MEQTVNYIGACVGAMFVLVVIMKIFVDRQMTVAEGIPIAAAFGTWGYLQLRGQNGGLLLAAIGLIMLARVYQRNLPTYRRRIQERLEANRAHKHRGP